MSEFHVGAGFSGIYAGNVKENKDGTKQFTGVRHTVTDDVLMAALNWLVMKKEKYRVECEDGTVYELKVDITKKEVQN